MRIYYIEPFLGFSHKHWIEGYQAYSQHEIEVLGLPARHWKWRMQGGAIALIDQLREKDAPDLFLVSDMTDLSLFKALLPDRFKKTPIALYFHENQFAYPISKEGSEQDIFHYGFINFKSALCAEKVYFNSQYNLDSFTEGCQEILKRLPDYAHVDWINGMKDKFSVLPLGMNFFANDIKKQTNPPLVLWNHRWEHDKNPELFFETLIRLSEEDVPFELAVLGEEFQSSPEIFSKAKLRLEKHIAYWGFQSRNSYEEIVKRAALLPVTSNQDFFGISVIEAAYAGVKPLLPRRLAYPEHFNDSYFYNDDIDFYSRLKAELLDYTLMPEAEIKLLERYSWSLMAKTYDQEFSRF